MGYSMGGMQSWLWAEQHPNFADGFVPMASQPSAMASRNGMMRQLMVETIRNDPTYAGGNYTAAPHSLPYAIASFGVATAGGNLPHAEYDLVPESSETRGHATLIMAKFYAARLSQFLESLPPGNAGP